MVSSARFPRFMEWTGALDCPPLPLPRPPGLTVKSGLSFSPIVFGSTSLHQDVVVFYSHRPRPVRLHRSPLSLDPSSTCRRPLMVKEQFGLYLFHLPKPPLPCPPLAEPLFRCGSGGLFSPPLIGSSFPTSVFNLARELLTPFSLAMIPGFRDNSALL